MGRAALLNIVSSYYCHLGNIRFLKSTDHYLNRIFSNIQNSSFPLISAPSLTVWSAPPLPPSMKPRTNMENNFAIISPHNGMAILLRWFWEIQVVTFEEQLMSISSPLSLFRTMGSISRAFKQDMDIPSNIVYLSYSYGHQANCQKCDQVQNIQS